MNNLQQLYQQTAHKTVVLLQHNQNDRSIAELLLKIMDYWDKPVDFYLENSGESGFSPKSEFILVAAEPTENLSPNIVLICETPENKNSMDRILAQITAGGILVYNEDDDQLKNAMENNKNAVKKYPYGKLEIPGTAAEIYLETNEGNLPLTFKNKFPIEHLMGVKWICQHMGIDEAEFYEALAGM